MTKAQKEGMRWESLVAASSCRVSDDPFPRLQSLALGSIEQVVPGTMQAHGFPPIPDYEPWEQHLPLGISISCLVILAICLSCYVSIIK